MRYLRRSREPKNKAILYGETNYKIIYLIIYLLKDIKEELNGFLDLLYSPRQLALLIGLKVFLKTLLTDVIGLREESFKNSD
jgi:hypothetical protein